MAALFSLCQDLFLFTTLLWGNFLSPISYLFIYLIFFKKQSFLRSFAHMAVGSTLRCSRPSSNIWSLLYYQIMDFVVCIVILTVFRTSHTQSLCYRLCVIHNVLCISHMVCVGSLFVIFRIFHIGALCAIMH